MKRTIPLFLLIMAFLSCVTLAANASNYNYLGQGFVVCGLLSIREKPVDNSGEYLTKVERGETLELLEKYGEWYKVRYKTFVGYALAKYIATNTFTVYAPQYTLLYSYPSGDAKCIAELGEKTRLIVIEEYMNGNVAWYCVYRDRGECKEFGFVRQEDCYWD